MKRLMISALRSGSGKTVLTTALLYALQARGMTPEAFKCGPDYLDPMFHSRVLGLPSRNLDAFLQGERGVLRCLKRSKAPIAVLEGAMGFYDGRGTGTEGSAWHIASLTDTPVLLVLRPKGESMTLAAEVQGILRFRESSQIAGLILTDCRPLSASRLQQILEAETGLPVLGALPPMQEAKLDSRHLGLLTPDEIEDFHARFRILAGALEEYADLNAILALAEDRPLPSREDLNSPPGRAADKQEEGKAPVCRIAVAMDRAFSFYYTDNLDALQDHGAELVFFSPLEDHCIPEADGLYLGGGYPELYLPALSENESMRRSIRDAVCSGMPTVAECGGFLYLQQSMRDRSGKDWPTAGVLPGSAFETAHLQNFGYLTLIAREDSLLFRVGEHIPAHEFHYWDCTDCGASLTVEKNGRTSCCGFATMTLYAAFPHLHWGGEVPMARRFVDAAMRFRKERGHDT